MKLILSNRKFYLQIDDKHFIDLSTGGVVTDVKDPVPLTLDALAAALPKPQASPKPKTERPKPKPAPAPKPKPKPRPKPTTQQPTGAFVAQLPQFVDSEKWLTKITLGFFKNDSILDELTKEFGPFGKMLATQEKIDNFSATMKDKYKSELVYRRYASKVNAFLVPVAIHISHKFAQDSFNQKNITNLLSESPFKDIPFYPLLSGTKWAIYAVHPDQSNDFGSFGSDIISYSYPSSNIKLIAVVNSTAAYGKFYDAIRAVVQNDPLISIFLISYLSFLGTKLRLSVVTNAIHQIKTTMNKWITHKFYPLPYLCGITSNDVVIDCGIHNHKLWKAIFKPLDW